MKLPIIYVGLVTLLGSWTISVAHADILISEQLTRNMSCSDGVCQPTAPKAALNVHDLTNMLASGDLTVQTGNGDDTTAGIAIVSGFSWANSSRLTLTAKNNITVKAPVTVAGNGALTITYAVGNPDGDLRFEKKGKIDFWDLSSSLIINGNSYTLAGDVKTLASDMAANARGSFALANDYDAGAGGNYPRSPLRTLLGIFEGLGHSITNLTIMHGDSEAKYPPQGGGRLLGLFYVNEGTIRDIELIDALIVADVRINKIGKHCFEGSLNGLNQGTILHASASGTVTGYNSGGLVGLNEGSILHSSADVIASGLYRAGGLVAKNGGYVANGSVIASHASGAVSAEISAGGLVGESGEGANGLVDQSYATGSVYVAGPGANRIRCQPNTDRKASTPATPCERGYAGGLFGLDHFGVISNSYATGAVAAPPGNVIGGFAGANREGAEIETSYSTGMVAETESLPLASRIGGFIGTEPHRGLENDDWDLDTSGQQQGCSQQCKGATGLSDAQLKSGLPAGFDAAIWGQSPNVNNGYPYLLSNPPPQ